MPPCPPLEETFAGNSWRVVDRPEAPAPCRFAVVGTAPTTFGGEVIICAVAYRPHAEAIAALPELVAALSETRRARTAAARFEARANCRAAIAKAEGRI